MSHHPPNVRTLVLTIEAGAVPTETPQHRLHAPAATRRGLRRQAAADTQNHAAIATLAAFGAIRGDLYSVLGGVQEACRSSNGAVVVQNYDFRDTFGGAGDCSAPLFADLDTSIRDRNAISGTHRFQTWGAADLPERLQWSLRRSRQARWTQQRVLRGTGKQPGHSCGCSIQTAGCRAGFGSRNGRGG